MRSKLLLITLFLLTTHAFSQYNGGNDDGAGMGSTGITSINVQSIYCNGGVNDGFTGVNTGLITVNHQEVFCSGGNEDGFAVKYTMVSVNNQERFSSGGSDDGFAVSSSGTVSINNNQNTYCSGGNEDGSALTSSGVISVNNNQNTYCGGGNNDGFALSSSGIISVNNNQNTYCSGGNNDGFALSSSGVIGVNNNQNTYCSGGNNDGFALASSGITGVNNNQNAYCSGGSNDGFALGTSGILAVNSNQNTYCGGGNNDGFAMVVLNPTPLNNQSFYCFGSNEDGFAQASSGTASLNNQTFYCYGGNGDGFAAFAQGTLTLNNQSFYCSGGNNDGFATDTSGTVVFQTPGLTKLHYFNCGITINNLDSTVYCNKVTGATAYQYRFTDSATSSVYTYIQYNGATNLRPKWIIGIDYGKTYYVEVRAIVNSDTGAYGTTCVLRISGLNNVETKLRTADCGITTELTNYVYCVQVGNATAYQYQFTDSATSAIHTYTREGGSVILPLSWVSGLEYGKTYYVKVRSVINADTGAYGMVCILRISSSGNITTKLRTLDCGKSLSDLQEPVYCVQVPGATAYQYRFTDSATSAIYIYIQSTGTVTLRPKWISGVEYGKTYFIEVRPVFNTDTGIYGASCTIRTLMKSTVTSSLQTADCGRYITNTNDVIRCNKVGNATAYQFKFTDTVSGQIYYYIRNNSVSILPQWVNGLQYGKQYFVQVRPVFNTDTGSYGNICLLEIAPFNTVSTKLRNEDCNKTLNTLDTNVYADAVGGATGYQYLFYNPADSSTRLFTRNSIYRNLYLAWVAGLSTGNTYYVQVRPVINSDTGSFGAVCTLTTVAAKMEFKTKDIVDNTRERTEKEQPEIVYKISEEASVFIYPNPSDGKTLFVGSADFVKDIPRGKATIKLYDIAGRQIFISEIFYQNKTTEQITFNPPLSPGFYLLEMLLNDRKHIQKVTVNN